MDQSSLLDPDDGYRRLWKCRGMEHRDEFAIQLGETGLETEDAEARRSDHDHHAPATRRQAGRFLGLRDTSGWHANGRFTDR